MAITHTGVSIFGLKPTHTIGKIIMSKAMSGTKNVLYKKRLEIFLHRIEAVEKHPQKDALHSIMDTPVFRDLETALMMATTYSSGASR